MMMETRSSPTPLPSSNVQYQLHGMLGQAASISAGAGLRQEDQRAAVGSEEAGPGLMLLVYCFLARDCQCCMEALEVSS